MHRSWADWRFLAGLVVVAALALVDLYLLSKVRTLTTRLDHVGDVVQQARASIDSAATASGEQFASNVLIPLSASVDSMVGSALGPLRDSVLALRAERDREGVRLEAAQVARQRSEMGLPGLVTLDSLGRHYARLVRDREGFAFETRRGTISFSSYEVGIGTLKEPVRVAWLRVGKKGSTEAGELIRAWLREAEQSKLSQGFRKVSSSTRPADYGEQTETVLERGDDYCRTFFQYQRIQGTYGRYSLEYTYYVEVGSKRRKQAFEQAQYTRGLGG